MRRRQCIIFSLCTALSAIPHPVESAPVGLFLQTASKPFHLHHPAAADPGCSWKFSRCFPNEPGPLRLLSIRDGCQGFCTVRPEWYRPMSLGLRSNVPSLGSRRSPTRWLINQPLELDVKPQLRWSSLTLPIRPMSIGRKSALNPWLCTWIFFYWMVDGCPCHGCFYIKIFIKISFVFLTAFHYIFFFFRVFISFHLNFFKTAQGFHLKLLEIKLCCVIWFT